LGRAQGHADGATEPLLERARVYADLHPLQVQACKSVVDLEGAQAVRAAADVSPEPRRGVLRRLTGWFR